MLLLVTVVTWIPWAVVSLWAAPFLYHSWRGLKTITGLLWPLMVGVRIFAGIQQLTSDRGGRVDKESVPDQLCRAEAVHTRIQS